MPLRGKNVNLGDKLNEMNERNIYMNRVFELTQKEEQEKTLQMLQEEDKMAAGEHSFTYGETPKHLKLSQSMTDASRSNNITHNSSLITGPQRTEPLITKAYDAFRRHKSLNKGQNLVPTEKYIDQQLRENLHERALSGFNNYSKFERSYITTAPHEPLEQVSPEKLASEGNGNWNVIIDSESIPEANVGS